MVDESAVFHHVLPLVPAPKAFPWILQIMLRMQSLMVAWRLPAETILLPGITV